MRLDHVRPRLVACDRAAVPRREVQAAARAGVVLGPLCIRHREVVPAPVVVAAVEEEHRAQVDRVELRAHVQVLAEPPVGGLGELTRAVTAARIAGGFAEHAMGLDLRALDVAGRRAVVVADPVQAVAARHVLVGPRGPLVDLLQVVAVTRGLVEPGAEHRGRGERLARLVGVPRVPPHAAVLRPAVAGGEAEGAVGVLQVLAVAGGAPSVDERRAPPAVVVEPDGLLVAVPLVGAIAVHRAVEVLLGARRDLADGGHVSAAVVGDGERVDGLEQRHQAPDRGEREARVAVQPVVVPVQAAVAPHALGLRDALVGQVAVAGLGAGERGGRRRARGSQGGCEDGAEGKALHCQQR